MTEFRTLTLADALAVVNGMRQWDRRCMSAMLGPASDDEMAMGRVQTTGPAWSMIVNGAPVAIGGVSFPNAWAGTFWFIATDAMNGHSWGKLLTQTRTVLRNITDPRHPNYRHRVEAWTLEEWAAADRLVAHLGFEREGLRRSVGARGESFNVWAITGPVKD